MSFIKSACLLFLLVFTPVYGGDKLRQDLERNHEKLLRGAVSTLRDSVEREMQAANIKIVDSYLRTVKNPNVTWLNWENYQEAKAKMVAGDIWIWVVGWRNGDYLFNTAMAEIFSACDKLYIGKHKLRYSFLDVENPDVDFSEHIQNIEGFSSIGASRLMSNLHSEGWLTFDVKGGLVPTVFVLRKNSTNDLRVQSAIMGGVQTLAAVKKHGKQSADLRANTSFLPRLEAQQYLKEEEKLTDEEINALLFKSYARWLQKVIED